MFQRGPGEPLAMLLPRAQKPEAPKKQQRRELPIVRHCAVIVSLSCDFSPNLGHRLLTIEALKRLGRSKRPKRTRIDAD